MRTIVGTSLVLAGALVGGLVCASVVSADAATTPAARHGARTIVVVERAVTDTTADTGPAGDSLGDILAFDNPIYDRTNQHRVGIDNGSCVRTKVHAAYECQWSLTLPGGSIVVEGPFFDAADSDLAITGGTGHFTHAAGEMHLHARNALGSAYDFTYRLTAHG